MQWKMKWSKNLVVWLFFGAHITDDLVFLTFTRRCDRFTLLPLKTLWIPPTGELVKYKYGEQVSFESTGNTFSRLSIKVHPRKKRNNKKSIATVAKLPHFSQPRKFPKNICEYLVSAIEHFRVVMAGNLVVFPKAFPFSQTFFSSCYF